MQIANNGLGLEAVEPAQVFDRSLERVAGFEGFQIADMLAEEHILADANGDGVLEMSADSKHWSKISGNADPHRRITARPAQDSRSSAGESHHRIIASANNRAVVHQKTVGNIFQAGLRFVVRDADRLVAAIAAGGN